MQNLRDKLLKVGLVDKKRKQEAENQARRERKQKGAVEQAQEEQARRQEYEARLLAEAEERRRLEADRGAERARDELHNRIRNIVDRWEMRKHKPGPQRFYFLRRAGRIGRLHVSAELAEQLGRGAVAIVERPPESGAAPDSEIHVLLPWEAAERILELDETAVRFWARSTQPIGITETEAPGRADFGVPLPHGFACAQPREVPPRSVGHVQ